MSESDLLIENPDRLGRADSQIVQNTFSLAFDLRFNSRVNDSCFHDFSVSHPQHSYQVIISGQRDS